jgi:hypothetical protein
MVEQLRFILKVYALPVRCCKGEDTDSATAFSENVVSSIRQ